MSADANTNHVSPADQRKALEQAEKKAAEQQPGSYKDAANKEKLVGIGGDITEKPIQGIDPVADTKRRI